MIDTRAVGQELQEQVLAVARKGQRRVNATMKNVTATAQMIRPQLPALPTIDLSNVKNTVKLPSPDELARRTERQLSQLRKSAPALVARIPNAEHLAKLTEKQLDQLRKTAPGLIAKLPDREHIKAGAAELADQMRTVQRQVTDQVRTVTTPLAEQAAAAFAQATGATVKTRKATHAGTQAHVTAPATSQASPNGSASTGHEPAASHNGGTPAPRKTRSTRTASARKAPATPAAASAKPAKPASRRSATTKKAKPTSK